MRRAFQFADYLADEMVGEAARQLELDSGEELAAFDGPRSVLCAKVDELALGSAVARVGAGCPCICDLDSERLRMVPVVTDTGLGVDGFTDLHDPVAEADHVDVTDFAPRPAAGAGQDVDAFLDGFEILEEVRAKHGLLVALAACGLRPWLARELFQHPVAQVAGRRGCCRIGEQAPAEGPAKVKKFLRRVIVEEQFCAVYPGGGDRLL
jgi:hypothetical protein